MSLRTTARVAAVAGVLALGTTTVLNAAPASAAKPQFKINYDTTGSTTLTNPNSKVTVTFAKTLLYASVNLYKDPSPVLATLPLAPVQASFKAYGFLPAKGTVVFTQVKPIAGTLSGIIGDNGPSLTGTAYYVVSLRDVVIGGAKANVGTNCQTINPVKVAVSTEPDFDLASGTIDGTYDLGGFQNCGAASSIINDTLPGTGNTLTLHITVSDDGSSPSRADITAARQQATPLT